MPPSAPGMYAGAPQTTGLVRQDQRNDGQHQAPPAPERLGNVYPGPLERGPVSVPGSQGDGIRPAALSADEEPHRFVRPLPRWAVPVGVAVSVLLFLGLIFLNPDWATGAMFAALIALILAVLLGIVAGVRVALGMLRETNPRRRSQIISTALLIILLLLFGGASLSQQSSIHLMQGHYLEGQQNWSAAISEYQAAGEKSDTSVDVARAYNAWGEDQSRHQQYAGAVHSFTERWTVRANSSAATP